MKQTISLSLFFLLTGVISLQGLAQSFPPKSLDYIIVPPEGGFKIGSGSWKLTTGQTGGAIAICELNNKDTTGWNWVPPHIHTREDELWYVMEGELTFKINNQLKTAGPGSLVFGPRNLMHSYRISKAPARYLLMLTPAGIDLLFLEVDSVTKRFPRGSPEWIKRVAPLSAKYGSYSQAIWDSLLNARSTTIDDSTAAELRPLYEVAAKWELQWNKHDMDSFATLFAWDVDFITRSGTWFKGRMATMDHHRKNHATIFKNSIWTTDSVVVKLVKPDLAILHVGWGISGDTEHDGSAGPPRHGMSTWVLTKQNKQWLLLAVQNADIETKR